MQSMKKLKLPRKQVVSVIENMITSAPQISSCTISFHWQRSERPTPVKPDTPTIIHIGKDDDGKLARLTVHDGALVWQVTCQVQPPNRCHLETFVRELCSLASAAGLYKVVARGTREPTITVKDKTVRDDIPLYFATARLRIPAVKPPKVKKAKKVVEKKEKESLAEEDPTSTEKQPQEGRRRKNHEPAAPCNCAICAAGPVAAQSERKAYDPWSTVFRAIAVSVGHPPARDLIDLLAQHCQLRQRMRILEEVKGRSRKQQDALDGYNRDVLLLGRRLLARAEAVYHADGTVASLAQSLNPALTDQLARGLVLILYDLYGHALVPQRDLQNKMSLFFGSDQAALAAIKNLVGRRLIETSSSRYRVVFSSAIPWLPTY